MTQASGGAKPFFWPGAAPAQTAVAEASPAEQLSALRDQAQRQGYEQGLAQAQAEAATQLQRQLQENARQCAEQQQQLNAWAQAWKAVQVETLQQIATELLGFELRTNSTLVQSLIDQANAALPKAEAAELRVSPDLMTSAAEVEGVSVREDSSLAAGSMELHADLSLLQFDLTQLVQELFSGLADELEQQ